MDKVTLKYGDSDVEISVEGAASVEYLTENPMREISDLKAEFLHAVEEGAIASKPLADIVGSGDRITVIISDITRFWMRQDKVLALLVDYLHDRIGVPFENIVVVVAIGTHRRQTEEELCRLASEQVYRKVRVVNHDCDADDLVTLGTTSLGTRVSVNKYAVGRKVIVISGTVHHLMAGYGGGRKSILPGISSRETIRQNHERALDPIEPHSLDKIGSGMLSFNPINSDMDEAAEMVAPVFGINIVVNTASKHSGLFCGDFHKAWLASCEYVQKGYGKPIDHEADIVLASCGGYPKDLNLYQSVKSLLNANLAVKKGGTVLLLAECREGGGAKDFFDWITPLKNGVLDAALRQNFTIGGYIFYAAVESIAKPADFYLYSKLEPDVVKDMGIRASDDMNTLLKKIDFTGKSVYVIPYGGSVVPQLEQTYEKLNREFR